MFFFTAEGCTNLIPPDDAWIKREDDKIIIGCYMSRQTWQLRCHDGRWTGVVSNCSQGSGMVICMLLNKKAVLSQGEPHDAAANFDTYPILQRHRAVSLLQHGCLVYISHRSNAEITHSTLIFTAWLKITALYQNHAKSHGDPEYVIDLQR